MGAERAVRWLHRPQATSSLGRKLVAPPIRRELVALEGRKSVSGAGVRRAQVGRSDASSPPTVRLSAHPTGGLGRRFFSKFNLICSPWSASAVARKLQIFNWPASSAYFSPCPVAAAAAAEGTNTIITRACHEPALGRRRRPGFQSGGRSGDGGAGKWAPRRQSGAHRITPWSARIPNTAGGVEPQSSARSAVPRARRKCRAPKRPGARLPNDRSIDRSIALSLSRSLGRSVGLN